VLDGVPVATLHMHSRCPTPSCVAAHQRAPMRSCAENGCSQVGQRSWVGCWSVRELMERSVMLWSLCPRLAGHYHQATSAGCRRTSTVVKPTVRRSPAHRSAAPQRGHDQQGRPQELHLVGDLDVRVAFGTVAVLDPHRTKTGELDRLLEPSRRQATPVRTGGASEPIKTSDASTADTHHAPSSMAAWWVAQLAFSSFSPSPGVTPRSPRTCRKSNRSGRSQSDCPVASAHSSPIDLPEPRSSSPTDPALQSRRATAASPGSHRGHVAETNSR
jgi:hypothetical protein